MRLTVPAYSGTYRNDLIAEQGNNYVSLDCANHGDLPLLLSKESCRALSVFFSLAADELSRRESAPEQE